MSPFIRHSLRLSSNTVLRFSIQMASTGPSSTSHRRISGVRAAAHVRKTLASTPSFHSIAASFWPYSWPSVRLKAKNQ